MIHIHPARLAAYSDEVHDEPGPALDSIRKCSIQYVCLRRAWTGNVTTLHDIALSQLKGMLGQLKVLMISSDLGMDLENVPDKEFEQNFLVANYFGAKLIRFHVGVKGQEGLREGWIKRVGDRAIKANIVPLLEYNPEYGNLSAKEISELLDAHPRWRFLYDPAQLVCRRNLDPFANYWTPLRDRTALVDLRDYKIGVGFRPVGLGDCRLLDTVKDANQRGYTGMFAIEPGLGRKFGSALTRDEVFKLAYTQLQEHL